MKTILTTAATLLALSATHVQASTAQLLAFGDSLLDSGNLNLAIQAGGGSGINDLPGPAGAPPRSYPDGQFTNGDTWATQLGLTPSLAGGTNFGYGGATAVRNGDTIPDLQDQIRAFRRSGIQVDGNTTAIIQIGGNDFRAFDPEWSTQQVNRAVRRITNNIRQSVRRLYRSGVSNIIVLGLPIVDALPDSVAQFNTRLTNIMARLDNRLAGSDISFFDTNSFFQQLIFQASQTRDLTFVPCVYDPVGCAANPESYVFYDEIHPSEWVHTALAETLSREVADNVSQVPLPASATFLLAGLGGLGLWARRRKSRV